MMIDLLKNRVSIEYGTDPSTIKKFYKTEINQFSLSDNKPCSICSNNKECDSVVLIVDPNGTTVNVVNFELFANSLKKFEKRCDYILYEDSTSRKKIVFCDLTCTSIKYFGPNSGTYPEGKRAYAFKQMKDTVEQLLKIDLINQYILTCESKECVLGWREPLQPTNQNKAARSMNSFVKTPSSMAKQLRYSDEKGAHDFIYKTIKYNTSYNW